MKLIACWIAHRLTGWWSWWIDPIPYGAWRCEKCNLYRWPQWYAAQKNK